MVLSMGGHFIFDAFSQCEMTLKRWHPRMECMFSTYQLFLATSAPTAVVGLFSQQVPQLRLVDIFWQRVPQLRLSDYFSTSAPTEVGRHSQWETMDSLKLGPNGTKNAVLITNVIENYVF